MNFQFYLEKLKNSKSFKNFIKESPDAFLCSGFFIIDKQNNTANQQHLDYFSPSKKELVSFCINDACQKNPSGMIDKNQKFEKISENCNFEFEEIEKLINDEIAKKGIKKDIQRVLLSLQSKEDSCFLIATIFISTLGLINTTIDLKNMKLTDFEKKSFFDMVNVFRKK